MASLPDPAVHTLANELILHRVRQGLTQENVANSLGVTRQAVSEWESSGGQVRLTTLASWAAALDMRLTLVPGNEEPVLRTDDGRPAQANVRTHVLLTGPAWPAVLPALLREHPGPVMSAAGADVPGSTPVSLAAVVSLLKGHAEQLVRSHAGVLVVDIDQLPADDEPHLRECLSRARAASWVVVAVAADADSVPPILKQNLGTALVAHHVEHVDADPFGGQPGVWHVG